MADLVLRPPRQEAQGRRRQMLRTAFGPTIAAALADPTRDRGDGQSRRPAVDRPGRRPGAATPASASARPRPSASSAWWPRTCAARCTDKAPIVSAELPETRRALRGRDAAGRAGAVLLDPQAGRRALPARRLCGGAHHDAARRPQVAGAGGARAHATSSSPAAPRRARPRSSTRCSPRSPTSTSASSSSRTRASSVRRGRRGGAAHQARRRLAGRSRALDAAAAARPHHRRRGARAPRRSTC